MNHKKRIAIIGATSAIAEQCVRLWAKETPREIILVGRNHKKVDQIAADLRVRAPKTKISSIKTDFLDSVQIQAVVDQICKEDVVDITLIAHGALPSQEDCQIDLNKCREALDINGVSPVLFAEAFVKYMQLNDTGTLAIIGSVAGDRGRRSNYVYGAAKELVSRYAQGLQHRLANSGVRVVLIKPGPTDTPMTAHLKQTGSKLANAEHVAIDIVRGISAGKTVIYTPRTWAIIMAVIRHLPNFIFKKMDI